MEIQLVEEDEVRTRGSGKRTKGEKYGKYAVAIHKSIPWIKEQITASKDGTIRIKVADIATEMGVEFTRKNPTSVYWALKYVLFNEGIWVDTGSIKNGEKILILRLGTDEDVLPSSLSKILEPADEDEPATEDEPTE